MVLTPGSTPCRSRKPLGPSRPVISPAMLVCMSILTSSMSRVCPRTQMSLVYAAEGSMLLPSMTPRASMSLPVSYTRRCM